MNKDVAQTDDEGEKDVSLEEPEELEDTEEFDEIEEPEELAEYICQIIKGFTADEIESIVLTGEEEAIEYEEKFTFNGLEDMLKSYE